MESSEHRELIFPRATSYLKKVRKAVLEVAGQAAFSAAQVRLLALAVDEAVSNIVEHGTPPPRSSIQVILDANPQRFLVVVRDQGRPFDPTGLPEIDIQQHVRKGRRRGLGIYIMRKVMDEVHYSFKQGGRNELQMIKYIDRKIPRTTSREGFPQEGVASP